MLHFSLSIELTLFVYNHWDLEDHWDNWDKICHEHLGRVVAGFYIFNTELQVFLPINLSFSICA